MRHITYIGIGSNLGDKIDQCEKAITEILNVDYHKLLAKSSFYKTKPLGYTSQDWFVNGVIKIETDLEALDLLRTLKTIEVRLGRTETFQWGPRTIDLDILLFDDKEIKKEELQIPHPHLHERQFVLIPLTEIDRNLVHPVLKKTIGELLENIEEDQGVEKLKSLPTSPAYPCPSGRRGQEGYPKGRRNNLD
jgi:2-amino-4-hydroxy-6-hydroxymethyldihydropteridine diphosphokinase